MEFRILGPVELLADGKRYDLGSRKERCILAVLVWELGRPVSADALVDHVWGDERPHKAMNSLYSYVSRLRSKLHDISGGDRDWVARHPGSYALSASLEEVDFFRFRRLKEEATSAAANGDDERTFALLTEAERLWRGVPLAGVDGAWAEGVRLRLGEDRYRARLDRLQAGLRLGQYADLVAEATELAVHKPLDETPVECLMRALFMSGRVAEALQEYLEFRNRFVDAVGNEPSARLRELHQQMLRNDPGLVPRQPTRPVPVDAPTRTMPRDNPDFTGRTAELDTLSGWLDGDLARSAVPVIVISGMAGVGKSALAVHAAHQRADRYPNQLYVNLRGHAPDEDPVDPGVALGTLLRALGLPGAGIPPGTEDRAAIWRSRLASRPTLVLLDDARDEEQVRPLLPGAPGCVVLITARRKIDLPGTRWMSLDPMPPPDAAALFARVSGRDHVDDPAVASVLRLCGYFPLEIQLAGSKLRRHPTWGADDLARRLREVRTEDRPVGTALALSCHYLTASQHQLLRQLALHPGPDFSSHAAAAAAGERSHADISSILDALQDCYLIEESAPGRYSFHDLVRSYAWHLTLTRDTDDDRQRTMQRIVDYYLRLADSADRAIFPGRRRSPARIGHVTGSSPTLRTTRDYRKWMETEQQTMLAVARSAIDQGLSEQASLLAHVLAHFLETRSCWADAADLHRRAVHTWRAAGNARGEARALIDLCHVLGRIGRNEEATDCAIQALAIVRNAPDPATEAEIHDSLGLILWQTSRYPEAMSHYEQALAVWRTLGDRHGEADVLAHSAAALWHVNRYSEAVRRTEQALAAYRELDDMRGVANTLNNLGDLHLGADHHQQASESYQLAREMFQSIGDRLGESTTLSNIGDIRRETGQGKEALPYYRTALDICREIGNPRYEANILNNLGAAYLQLGYYENALDQYQKGLVLAHGLAERFLEAQSHRGSGDAHLAVGNPRSADVSYRTALELSQRIGDQYLEAQALHGLGQTLANEHDVVAAAEHLREALGIFTSIGKSRDADMVRVHLHELGNNVA